MKAARQPDGSRSSFSSVMSVSKSNVEFSGGLMIMRALSGGLGWNSSMGLWVFLTESALTKKRVKMIISVIVRAFNALSG